VILSFKSLPHEELIKQYCEAGVNQYAAIVAALTQNLDEGIDLAQSERLVSLIELLLKTEDCFVKTKLDPSILLAQHQELFKEKDSQLLYLKLFMIYYEDVLRMKLGKTEHLAFRMYPSSLAASEQVNTTTSCLNKLRALLEAEKRLMANANVMLCFDQLFIEMRGGF
ncbi:MAG: DNA polymerase III subunit delta', partial [Turicibacter sp.]|nr:DNA polymerase III subunit delta' [Turicibacter sp.]